MDTKNQNTSTDKEIREALHRKKLIRHHACEDTLVIDELGLAHAQARIDIAVINGCVHGYEIKSAMDSLTRLPRQMELYQACLEKLTIVCAPKHIDNVINIVPSWCGVILASKGPRGGIYFSSVQTPTNNPEVKREQLAHLLWREEAHRLLEDFGVEPSKLRQPRKALYRELASLMSTREITTQIKYFMSQRRYWRDHQVHA